MTLLAKVALGLAASGLAAAILNLYWRLRWGPPAKDSVPILAYHKVDTRFELGGTWVTPARFGRQVKWLTAHGYRAITVARAGEMSLRSGQETGSTVCLTFDDAYQGVYRHAYPILMEHGFTATVFALSSYVGKENVWDVNWGGRRFRHLDWPEMREMRQAGIEIGSHGQSHRELTGLSDIELDREVTDSKKALEDGLGSEVTSFCYPFGRYDHRVRGAVIRAGYHCACSHSPRMPNSRIDVFALRRSGVYITDTIWDFKNKVMIGSRGFWVQDLWSRAVNFCAGGTFMLQRVSRRKTGTIIHTKNN